MGTRSLTIVKTDDGKTDLCVMYRQFDGYIEAHGKELADFLKGRVLVNGFSMGEDDNNFNGLPCLAASLVAKFKTGIGAIYLHPANTRDCGEEYRYTISAKQTMNRKNFPKAFCEVAIKAESGYGNEWETIFEGSPEELADFKEPVAA